MKRLWLAAVLALSTAAPIVAAEDTNGNANVNAGVNFDPHAPATWKPLLLIPLAIILYFIHRRLRTDR